MRLIDADKIDNLNKYKFGITMLNLDEYVKVSDLENLETAYDIDKVVEELQEFLINYGVSEKSNVHQRIIKIVKYGGVSDDVCEWNGERSKLVTFTRFTTNCGDNIDLQANSKLLKAFRYCPFCGKKIKIVGD